MDARNDKDHNILVEDYMTVATLTMNFRNSVLDVAKKMVVENISSIAMTEDNRIVGILTERDIVKIAANEVPLDGITAGSLMSSPPVKVKNNAPIEEAAIIMAQKRVRHLLVENSSDNSIMGIITVTDLVRYLKHKSHTGETPASEVWEIFF